MHVRTNIFTLLLLAFLTTQCSSSTSIFPLLPTTTETASVKLPNPISIAVDTANSQILVVNSNVDYIYNQGSLATISVDATTTTAPTLLATAIVATPNFGGAIWFDGTYAYVPFRQGASESSDADQVARYTIGAGSITGTITGSTGENPFGIALSGADLLIASNKELNILTTGLASNTTIDLTTATTAGISDADSLNVENIAMDTARNRAFLSNRAGNILVVDLNTNQLTHVISGPTSTRGILYDGTYVYAVDGSPPALWIFDPAQITAATNPPEAIDDSKLVVEVIDLGTNPNGIAIDVPNSRAYVANTGEQSVSVIDLLTLTEIDRISLKEEDSGFDDGIEPFGLAVGTFNAVPFVFVANVNSNNIHVINANTLKVVAEFP